MCDDCDPGVGDGTGSVDDPSHWKVCSGLQIYKFNRNLLLDTDRLGFYRDVISHRLAKELK